MPCSPIPSSKYEIVCTLRDFFMFSSPYTAGLPGRRLGREGGCQYTSTDSLQSLPLSLPTGPPPDTQHAWRDSARPGDVVQTPCEQRSWPLWSERWPPLDPGGGPGGLRGCGSHRHPPSHWQTPRCTDACIC